MQLTRTHRVLIGVVVAGAVLIAAIGFAGSYAAVRELAEEKGFGEFSVVFPIGIDAGICVLLALDLLLTWMRIPFPLLRQTAWLLTAATIAFNGAAAWPDPLGTGMHAVIPILFVVAVEAARHAVGRIADITADKHMEGVRLTRWLLSPVPTFKLWRRMKLWELRSYEQVIKLEQDRLIYQARLQARFGRNWRRKAPVESMMPLRLAKYGVPLAETAPAGLAAAGIEPPAELASAPRTPEPGIVDQRQNPQHPRPSSPAAAEHSRAANTSRTTSDSTTPSGRPTESFNAFAPAPRRALASAHERRAVSMVIEQGTPRPIDDLATDQARDVDPSGLAKKPDAMPSGQAGAEPESAPTPFIEPEPEPKPARAAVTELAPEPAAEAELPPVPEAGSAEALTTVDRYYLAWSEYLQLHEHEPRDTALSQYLAENGMTGRGGGPVSPSTLRRYLPLFRIYAAWSQHLDGQDAEPTPDELSRALADRGITGAPYTPEKIAPLLSDFPRRRSALDAHISAGHTA
ncbi:DUF2637 domain-containing protein [Streptomyces sp. NBC_01422]|uniref:DUF2637 domain-containing protein n=1 Tax=Streptomyces sp. NBC_01422 TaxID=2903859 RepID=UPI002E2A38A7|nr:DUF2637 domain-containing protein [Streptomyces sp. NBC_01422]